MSQPTCTKIRNCLTYTSGGSRKLTTVVVPNIRGPNHARFSAGNLFMPNWTTYLVIKPVIYVSHFFPAVLIGFTLYYLSCNPISRKFRDKVTFGRHTYDLFSSHTRAFPICVRHARISDLITGGTYLCMMAQYGLWFYFLWNCLKSTSVFSLSSAVTS